MKIGILNLDASIPMYHEALRYLSYSLIQRGVEVTHLGCNSALQRCVNINSFAEILTCEDLDARKKAICSVCQRQQNKIETPTNFAVSSEQDKLTAKQEALLDKITANLARVPQALHILDLTYENIELCKIAFFDFSIVGKVTPLSMLDDEEVGRLIQHIRDCLVLHNFFQRVGESNHFDIMVYVNGNYSQNTYARTALKNNVATFLSLEFQFSSYKIWNRIFFEKDRLAVGPKWPAISFFETSYKLNHADLESALRIMQHRFLGNDYNSYTKPGTVSSYAEFDAFRGKYRRLISYFSCSTDELYSHIVTHSVKSDTTFYADQYEMMSDLIKNAQDDIGYVVRVHPRLAPNKRDRVLSREIFEMRKYLDLLRAKENFFIIEAENPISSYYVMLKTDLVLVAWSTMALEAMVAGKPAFALFPTYCIFPMKELCRQPSDIQEFREVIQGKIPFSEYTVNELRLMKWISMVYNALGKPIPSPRGSGNSFIARIYNILYYRLITRTWAYRLFMAPLSSFSSEAVDGLINGGMLLDKRSGQQDDAAGGLNELDRFRRKIRKMILH